MVDTTTVALLTALGQLLTALPAAYAFAAWQFPFQQLLYLAFIGTRLVTGHAQLRGRRGKRPGPPLAGLACLPIFAPYLVLQRHILNAFVRSGLK